MKLRALGVVLVFAALSGCNETADGTEGQRRAYQPRTPPPR